MTNVSLESLWLRSQRIMKIHQIWVGSGLRFGVTCAHRCQTMPRASESDASALKPQPQMMDILMFWSCLTLCSRFGGKQKIIRGIRQSAARVVPTCMSQHQIKASWQSRKTASVKFRWTSPIWSVPNDILQLTIISMMFWWSDASDLLAVN